MRPVASDNQQLQFGKPSPQISTVNRSQTIGLNFRMGRDYKIWDQLLPGRSSQTVSLERFSGQIRSSGRNWIVTNCQLTEHLQ